MRTIVHLSDLHFGKIDTATLEPLKKAVKACSPDIVVVSGDLTQRATHGQFKEAREFLSTLPQPQLIVPGNHDVPLYNVYARFLKPHHKYISYIHSELEPYYLDNEVAIVGINTTRSLTIKDGRINRRQIREARERFAKAHSKAFKIVVSHHPFDMPESYTNRRMVERAKLALKTFAQCGVHMFLGGHFHKRYFGTTSRRYNLKGYSAFVLQAGTATSTRVRKETPSFNVVEIKAKKVTIKHYSWNKEEQKYIVVSREKLVYKGSSWIVE